MMRAATAAGHFEALYSAKPDPWNLATSPYEVAKYAVTVAALGGRHFRQGMEVGCAIGTLTRQLAPHCDALLGIDLVEAPLADARARCADFPHVRFERMTIPDEWPAGQFDLIVLSEVIYFLSLDDLSLLAARCTAAVEPGGMVMLVNWLGPNDGTMSGEAAAQSLLALLDGWACENVVIERDYRIDVAIRGVSDQGLLQRR